MPSAGTVKRSAVALLSPLGCPINASMPTSQTELASVAVIVRPAVFTRMNGDVSVVSPQPSVVPP